MTKFEDVQRGYANLWARAKIRPERDAQAQTTAKQLAGNRARYAAAGAGVGAPWWWVAIIHQLESSANFARHLHNGDPLSARTVHVPAGRPATGSPPFTWEQSAADALKLAGVASVKSWTVPRALYEWERYNGFGYVSRGVNSPYVWSFTDLYIAGRFVADGKFDAGSVSQQCGAAAILRALIDLGEVEDDMTADLQDFLAPFKSLAPTIATAISGPAAGLAVKALAEAIGPDTSADATAVKQQLDAAPLSKLMKILGTAEAILGAWQPAAAPIAAPVETAPAQPTTSGNPLDSLFPALTGWKTIIGTVLLAAVVGAHDLQLFPAILTDGVTSAIEAFAGGVIGIGLVAKVDRIVHAVTGKAIAAA